MMLSLTVASQPGSTSSWLCPRLCDSRLSLTIPRPACDTKIPMPLFSLTTLPLTIGFALRRMAMPLPCCPEMVFRSTIPADSSVTSTPCCRQSFTRLFFTTGADPMVMQIPDPAPAPCPALSTVLDSMYPFPLCDTLIPSEWDSTIVFFVTRGSASLSISRPIPALLWIVFPSMSPRPAKQTEIPSPSLSLIVLFLTTGFARFMMYSPTDWLQKMSFSSIVPSPSSTHVTPQLPLWWIWFPRISGSALLAT
mmetsp:Transcript_30830/g.69513  ORF Transcript_30830/g.69513 Transcript_30830/m.69513 type:complete len:251 (+) Transcript_30830:690-1442(+)